MDKMRKLWLFIAVFLTALVQEGYSADTLFVQHQSDIQKIKRSKAHTIRFGSGIFLIPKLEFTQEVSLVGNGSGTILKATEKMPYLIVGKSNMKVYNLTIDGSNKASVGLYAYKNLEVWNSTIQNFYGDAKTAARGIRTVSYTGKLLVNGSTIRNIGGYADGKVGNSIGAHRGILTVGNSIKITNSTFENIFGKEDADAIHISTKRVAGKWTSANALIDNCRFINFGKRAIKLQSSGNRVTNSYFSTSNTKPANAAISVYGVNNTIKDNEFDVAVDVALISLNGAQSTTVENNNVSMKRAARLFYVTRSKQSTVKNNRFKLKDKSKPLSGFTTNADKVDFSNLNQNNQITSAQ